VISSTKILSNMQCSLAKRSTRLSCENEVQS